MNKTTLTLLLLLLTSFHLIAQQDSLTTQDDSYDLKVKKMLKLSGASKNFDVAVKNMLDLQRETSISLILTDEFFDELEKEMLEIGFEKLAPKFTPLYKKYLTEEDLDAIIAFHESDAGKRLAEINPLLLNDAMKIGEEWGGEMGMMIYERMNQSNEVLFEKEIEEDCSIFREGKFQYPFEKMDNTIIDVERKEGLQIETFDGKTLNLTIKWTSNNKYTLQEIPEDNPDAAPIEVSIYEVNGNSYKYVARQLGVYQKGEITKLDE